MIKTKSLWPHPIWRTKIESVNNKDLIQFILDEQVRRPVIVEKSNHGGWQSRTNLFENIELSGLCEEIFHICNELWPTIIKGIQVRQMWAAINKRNDWNSIHMHGDYQISGGYYLCVPENSGRIVFRDPSAMRINSAMMQLLGGELYEYQPKEYDLIMWPSYLDHYVEPSESDEDRIMLSFDLDLKS